MNILKIIKYSYKYWRGYDITSEIHENKIIKQHVEFLIQQNNELGSRLQSLYAKLTECEDADELLELNSEIDEILRESERLVKRIETLKELG